MREFIFRTLFWTAFLLPYLLLKIDRLRVILNELFMIERFSNYENYKNARFWKDGLYYFLIGISYLMRYFYIVSITWIVLDFLETISIDNLISIVVMLIIYPIGYRYVVGFQILIHRIGKDKNPNKKS